MNPEFSGASLGGQGFFLGNMDLAENKSLMWHKLRGDSGEGTVADARGRS
jgi:hypothetical protein